MPWLEVHLTGDIYCMVYDPYILPFVQWLFDHRTTAGANHFLSPALPRLEVPPAADILPLSLRGSTNMSSSWKPQRAKHWGGQAGIKTPTMHWHIVGQPQLAEVIVWELSANTVCDSRGANAGNVAQECFLERSAFGNETLLKKKKKEGKIKMPSDCWSMVKLWLINFCSANMSC